MPYAAILKLIFGNWRVWAGIGLLIALAYAYFWHEDRIREVYQQGYAAAEAKDRAAAQILTLKLQKEKDDAVKQAEARTAALQVSLARSRADADRLRNLLSDAGQRIATASAEAVREYALVADEVFGQCVREYQDVAAKADGHAADVQTLIDAWPHK